MADWAAVGTMVAAVIGSLIAISKLSGERRSIKITSEQGAATIYDNLVRTLQAEVTRLNDLCAQKDFEAATLRRQIEELEHDASS